MTKILLVIKNDLFRMGIVTSITEYDETFQVQSAEDWASMQMDLEETEFDVIIIDTSLSSYSNLIMLEKLRSKKPDIKIIILGEEAEKEWAIPYLRKGVDGVCIKTISKTEFQSALKTVLMGKKYLDDELSYFLLMEISNPNLINLLTARESEIMQFLLKGQRTAEIARELKLAVSTISTMKNNIYRKMKVNNIVDLVGKVNLLQHRA
jgi:DNA-binding NarL/FixJ family response regulator